MILVTPKQELEQKNERFCEVQFFRSNFKVEWENGVWTKILFLPNGFWFTCGNLILTLFFSKYWSDFITIPSSYSVLDLVFCLVHKISLNCTSGRFPAMFFNSLYFLITFFVLHKSRFSRLTSYLLHVLFLLNCLLRIQLRNVVKTAKVKRSKSKETG